MLRIDRTLQTLNAWKETVLDQVMSVNWVHGDYPNTEAAKKSLAFEGAETSKSIETASLPWKISSTDDRFFLWFEVLVPEAQPDAAYYLKLSTGREGEWDAVNPQLLAFVDGEVICGIDVNHQQIFMRPEWLGKRIEVGLHLYTGMASGDLCIRVKMIKRSLSIYNAYHDLRVAKEALACMPAGSEEAVKIQHILLSGIQQMRLVNSEDTKTREALKSFSSYLHTVLYGQPSTMGAYTVHAVGHTHIDVAWLWDLKQTREKTARSFATVLDLQRRYPEYKFMASQPILYEMVAEGQPSVFNGVQSSYSNGLWELEGAMYLEADCNLISGESMIRQIEWGQRYYETHFGQTSRTLWLPDVFGYSAALPQILNGFGIELFVTSKISWNDTNKMPYDSFKWRGLDGTEIPTQFITTASMETLNKGEFKTIYEGNCNATETLGAVLRHQQRSVQPHVLMPFGYGDGGGGATEEMLENARRLVKGLPGMPSFKMSHVADFLDAFKEAPLMSLPVWSGELYLEYHRGTYTTNGGIKQRHRQLENALLRAERFQAQFRHQCPDTKGVLEAAWKMLLLNQFHDILPGTSIKSVYNEAYSQLDHSLSAVKQLMDQWAEASLRCQEHSFTIYNGLGHTFNGIIEIPEQVFSEEESVELEGARFAVQPLKDGRTIAHITHIKPLAITEGWVVKGHNAETVFEKTATEASILKTSEGLQFETPYYQVRLDNSGNITDLFDRAVGRAIISENGFGNRLQVFEDRPLRWDAWDINADYIDYEMAFEGAAEVNVIQNGAVALVIQIIKRIGASVIDQTLYFYKNHRRIDFNTHVDWHEQQVLLRTTFDLAIHAMEAKYDIQFGHVKRPIDQNNSYHSAMFEVCAAHWGDLSEDNYGVALMSDDKFGYSALGSSLGLSLIKSPTWPNEASDQGEHKFNYSLYPHEGDAIRGRVHQEALNFAQAPMGFLNTSLKEKCLSWVQNLPENLVLESLRCLPDNSFELRLVEHYNRRGQASVTFSQSFSQIEKVSLSGESLKSVIDERGGASFTYRPFEIVTLRMR